MSTKVKIKIGSVEVEFEGSEEFLKSELMKLATSVSELSKEIGMVTPPGGTGLPSKEEGKVTPPAGKIQWAVETIASKLKCTTGQDLVTAACAYLTFVEENKSFARKEILDQMKKDTSRYSDTHNKNLSYYLKTLVANDVLNKLASNAYALTSNARKELRIKLGLN